MKPHYFEQGYPDPDDYLLRMAIGQGHVAKDCLLGGAVIIGLVNDGQNPCHGCSYSKCNNVMKQDRAQV